MCQTNILEPKNTDHGLLEIQRLLHLNHFSTTENTVPEYLHFNSWWLVVNSKEQFHVNKIGNAIKTGDGKVEFLRNLRIGLRNRIGARTLLLMSYTANIFCIDHHTASSSPPRGRSLERRIQICPHGSFPK